VPDERKGRESFPAEVHFSLVNASNNGSGAVICIARDITERKKSEARK
jgi:PAS domain S-box-containing protein